MKIIESLLPSSTRIASMGAETDELSPKSEYVEAIEGDYYCNNNNTVNAAGSEVEEMPSAGKWWQLGRRISSFNDTQTSSHRRVQSSQLKCAHCKSL